MDRTKTQMIIGLFLTIVLMLNFVPGMVMPVHAADITIISPEDSDGDAGEHQLAADYSGTITIGNDVKKVTIKGTPGELHSGTCIVVAGGRTDELELTIRDLLINAPVNRPAIDFGSAGGYAHKLYIGGVNNVVGGFSKAGINVPDGIQLTIDKELSDDEPQLTANGGGYGAGIGGGQNGAGGTITVAGGTVIATGGSSGAGIGGGYNGVGGTITITGGTVTVIGGSSAAGIGGGENRSGVSTTITGGTVIATGGNWGAGIGGGDGGFSGGTITLQGGTVTATGGNSGAGIGCGGGGRSGGTITIQGGTVTANGGSSAAGIGGGIGNGNNIEPYGTGGTITIEGGTVSATGGSYGAGIGGGLHGTGGIKTISGGMVTATGGIYGAGIGGGGYGGAFGRLLIIGEPMVIATGDTANGARHIGKGNGNNYNPSAMYKLHGDDLNYLRFNITASGTAANGAEIVLKNTGAKYIATSQGLSGIFVPQFSRVPYTVSKEGYAALQGSINSEWNLDINIQMEADSTPTNINNVSATAIEIGTVAAVSFNNDYGIYGKVYLLPKVETAYTNKTSLEAATGGKSVVVNSPATSTSLDTTGLTEGSYQVYMTDSAGNVSEPFEVELYNLPSLVSAQRLDNTRVKVTLSKDCTEITKNSDGGFTVHETGRPDITYAVSSVAQDVDARHAVLTVDNFGISGNEGITIKYTAGENGTVQALAGYVMPTDNTGVMIAAWDTTPPDVTFSHNNPTTRVRQGAEVTITAAFNEDMADTPTITISNGGVTGVSMINASGDKRTWTYTWRVPGGNFSAAVTVAGADIAGNNYSSNDSLTFTIDNSTRPASRTESSSFTPPSGSNPEDSTTSVSENQLRQLMETAQVAEDGGKTILLQMKKVETANSYTLDAPINFLSSQETKNDILVTTPLGTIGIPDNMLTGMGSTVGEKASITIGQGDKTGLPENVRELIGDRPLVQLNLAVDGERVSWNNPDAPVTVSIQYTPTPEELAHLENIVVWYIDGGGNVVEVPSGRYNAETGMVTFKTHHFSYYAIAYMKKTFDDLESVAWAKYSIEVLASKGILSGTSANEYSPHENITRAEFLYFLVKTLGVDTSVDNNFDDIRSEAYYFREIAIAKKLGITNGTGNNKYNPDMSITRQDMIVLVGRALKMLKKLNEQGTASVLDKYSDKSLIASYAINEMVSLSMEELIVGSNGKIYPLSDTNRAEAAVILYRIYSKY